MKLLFAMLLAIGLVGAPAPAWSAENGQDTRQDQKKDKKDKKQKDKKAGSEAAEAPTDATEIGREVTRILRDLQFALEGGSATSVLALIDSARFDDYQRFEDQVERLTLEDTIRANFRQVTPATSAAAGKARSTVDAALELTRRDSLLRPEQRNQQLVIDFEYTRRGWRVTNITPRDFFRPL